MGCPGDKFTMDSEMSGSKARHSTLKACARVWLFEAAWGCRGRGAKGLAGGVQDGGGKRATQFLRLVVWLGGGGEAAETSQALSPTARPAVVGSDPASRGGVSSAWPATWAAAARRESRPVRRPAALPAANQHRRRRATAARPRPSADALTCAWPRPNNVFWSRKLTSMSQRQT